MLLCIIFFLIPASSAGIVDDILNLTYVDNTTGIDYSSVYYPDTTIQSGVYILGWVDIIGYKNLSYKGDVFYIQGDPVDDVIIMYDYWSADFSWNCAENYIEVTDERIILADTTITSEIDIHLNWYKSTLTYITICTPLGCRVIPRIKKTPYDEYFTLTDSDILPSIYPTMDLKNTSIEAVIYNNTISPKTTIKLINTPINILTVEYTYNDSSITHYLGAATVEYTDKNCPYMYITSIDSWNGTGNLSHFNEFMFIPTMNFLTGNLSVVVNDPYSTNEIHNITVYELPYHSVNDTFSSLFFGVVAILLIFAFGILYQIKRLSCR